MPSTRTISFPDGSARVKTYACSLPGAKEPQLQIEIDRLSEAAAGSLLEGTPYPDVTRALAVSHVVKNPVFVEAKHLFDTYGTKSLISSCYKTTLQAAAGGKSFQTDSKKQACGDKRTLWYFTFPDQENLTTRDLSLPDDQRDFKSTTHWPAGWHFFYADCEKNDWIECTTIWRPSKPLDIDDFLTRIKQEEKRDGLADAAGSDDATIAPDDNNDRYFALVKHLNATGWHDDFLTVTGYAPVCGDGIIFSMHIRQMALDTAFIRNVSASPITIDGLFGAVDGLAGLRTAADASRGGVAGELPGSPTVIGPGEVMAVPLRMSFLPAGGVDAIFQSGDAHHAIDLAAAQKDYQAIAKLPPGTIVRPAGSEGGTAGGKLKESFGPPSVPPQPAYVWGPAYDLKAFTVGGQRVALDAPARNFLTIAAGEGYGSCPYLYVYDEVAKDWVWHGKIIHNASSPAKEMTQVVELPGLSTRFSIREEELEVSTIRTVALTLHLADRDVSLTPRTAGSPTTPEAPILITAGREWDFAFDLPPGVIASDVRRSTLSVTGYYRPYSSLASKVKSD